MLQETRLHHQVSNILPTNGVIIGFALALTFISFHLTTIRAPSWLPWAGILPQWRNLCGLQQHRRADMPVGWFLSQSVLMVMVTTRSTTCDHVLDALKAIKESAARKNLWWEKENHTKPTYKPKFNWSESENSTQVHFSLFHHLLFQRHHELLVRGMRRLVMKIRNP